VDGKTNEITAFAPRLDPLDLAGSVVTADVSYGEYASQIRTESGPQVMASLRNLSIAILKMTGHASIAAACRHHARDATRTLATLGISPA
jgi:hypothetical protein